MHVHWLHWLSYLLECKIATLQNSKIVTTKITDFHLAKLKFLQLYVYSYMLQGNW